ncbi:SDR family oxidoreductase [Pollutimonas bauzanensis]|uniref:SDR family NAD(P)-dependent oxidoreductase n=1 Tax=Pollutimonas bauzanensis TaxID=658167 RepID=UPI0033401037
MQDIASFSGKTALVTGGASGIGRACVELLRARGATVIVADVNYEQAIQVAMQSELAWQADVASIEQIEGLADSLQRNSLQVDLLVNCAGIVQSPLSPHQLDHHRYREVLSIDLDGTYNCCTVFGSAMARRGFGAIVNIASVAGMRSMPLYAYSPAKAAVISLTECLAAEWGRSGVRVNAVSPGYTVTAALQGQIDQGLRDPEKLKENSALGMLIKPEDIARAIGFLLSDEASMITGINLPVDAGWLVSGSWSTFGGVRPRYESDAAQ